VQKKLVALGVLDRVVDDFADIPNKRPKKLRDKVVDALIHKLGEPYHQLMVIANTNGHNWIYRRWKKEKWPGYELCEANSFENDAHILTEDLNDWKRLQVENPKKYARMVMNSWEDLDIEGSYYADLMSDALKGKRMEMDTLYDKEVPVYTFWDLGVRASDTTAIWFVQFIGEQIWLVDYLEDYGKGMNYYSKELDRKPYSYAAHYLPHDAKARLQGETVVTRLKIMRKLRREPVRIVPKHRVEERIATVRGLLNRCKFNSNCEKGVESLINYSRKKYEKDSADGRPVFMSQPDHKWSNGADAFGYMAVVKRFSPPTQDAAYLSYSDEQEWIEDDGCEGVTDLLKVG
jgi:hypothetical protein